MDKNKITNILQLERPLKHWELAYCHKEYGASKTSVRKLYLKYLIYRIINY